MDEIWVADGSYMADGGRIGSVQTHVSGSGDRAASFHLINGVGVYGGFVGTETQRDQRDPALHVTILSGDLLNDDGPVVDPSDPTRSDNSLHVVTANGTDTTAILDGFTVTAGNANSCSCQDLDSEGGGLALVSASHNAVYSVDVLQRVQICGAGGIPRKNALP